MRKTKIKLSIACLVLIISGCVQFVPIENPSKKSIVQRTVQDGERLIVDYSYAEEFEKIIGEEDRVIWIKGVDLDKASLQRNNERLTGNSFEHSQNIEHYSFDFIDSDLSLMGKMSIDKFKAKKTDRFYVEILNQGAMTESSAKNPLSIWKKILPVLEGSGLNSKNVIMGGAKYNQGADSIILVKIGR